MANFDHTESKTLTRLQKFGIGLIYYVHEATCKPILVQVHPVGACGKMSEIQRFCAFFLSLYFFLRLAYNSGPLTIFTRASSKHEKLHKDVPFGC